MINIFKKKEKPRYREIELEAKNDKLKDELIESLQRRVESLEYTLHEIRSQRDILAENMNEIGKISNEEQKPQRLKVSTMTQLAGILEAASISRKRNKENPDDKSS